MGNAITPEQLEALVQYAAHRLHMSPQELSETVQTQGLSGLAGRLPPKEAEKLPQKMPDKTEAEEWLRSPQVQELLRRLSGGDPT